MKTKRDKFAEGVPLAMIIKRQIKPSAEIVMLSQPRSVYAEKFRRLKSTLVHTHGDQTKVIVVTSALPGEGKSTVSLNLALAFAADTDAKILLIDGDLRRPNVASKIDPAPQLGLTEVLTERADLVHAIVHFGNTALHVLPAGAVAGDPHELVTSTEAKDLFRSLRERYDRIIVDTPPIIPFTEADSFGVLSDGMLLVVRAGTTPKAAYTQELTNVTSTRILGAVLNSAQAGLIDGKPHYDDYYHSYYERSRTEDT